MFNAEPLTARGQQLDLNHSAVPISKTLPAGGHRDVDGTDGGLDEYINNVLAPKSGRLAINDPPLTLYICPQPGSSSVPAMLMRGQRSPSRCQAGGATSRSSQLEPARQNTASHENLLSEAEEALRRHITHKTNRLYAEHGPDSSRAFLSALCELSTESFDQLWAGVLHVSTSNKPAMPPASDTGSRPPDSNNNGKSRAGRTQVWEGRLERFAANAIGDLIQFVDRHWEQLMIGLNPQEFQGDHLSVDKRLRRFYHHLELRKLDQDVELHWLRRALALIRNLHDFEEYLEEAIPFPKV